MAIETPRGLLVAALRATGRNVCAINPLAAAHYRDRSSVAPAKSDAADARVLANILRTDMATHRPLPTNSELVQAVAVLARAHQDAVWEKTQMVSRLRSHLREYYPAALQAFHGADALGLDSRHARTDAATPELTASDMRCLGGETASGPSEGLADRPAARAAGRPASRGSARGRCSARPSRG